MSRPLLSSLALVALLAASCPAIGQSPQPLPLPLPGPSTPDGTLLWWNGESVPGRPVEASGGSIRWKSPLFETPASLAMDGLRLISLPAEAKPPEEPFAVITREGSRLYGAIEGIDGGRLILKSRRHGQVTLDLAAVASLQRLSGGGMLWSGPFGDLGWKHPNNTPDGRRWIGGPGGSLVSRSLQQAVTLPRTLDRPIEIAFEIRSTARPEFDLTLLGTGAPETLATWDDELVLRRGDRFLPILTLGEADRTVSLRLFWDPKTHSGAVATPEGRILARWQTAPAAAAPGIETFPATEAAPAGQTAQRAAPPAPGITWRNRGPDLTIESLRLRDWNGTLPGGLSAPGPATAGQRIELTDGSLLDGQIQRVEAGALVAQIASPAPGERRIALDELLSVRFIPGTAAPAAPPAATTMAFADGSTLKGNLTSLADGKLTVQSPASSAPIAASDDGLREIRWHTPPKSIAELETTDKLTIGTTTLHGAWAPAAGPRLHWRLIGASEAVALAPPRGPVEIVRATPSDRKWPKSPALFFLKDGQIAPGELVSIDEDGASVSLRSDIVGVERFDATRLDAVQFSGPEIKPDGFIDPGWRYLRGKAGTGRVTGLLKDTVTLDAGESLGHPSILAGDEIRFQFIASGFGTVRLRLFGDGMARETPATRILIAHYGNQVYCGLEENEGNFSEQSQVPTRQNEPAAIRVAWTSQQLQVFVNGTLGFTTALNRSQTPRSGRGLIIEPANLWGNGDRPVTVSGFAVRVSPGYTWVPPVALKAREQALFLPRFRKGDPPGHLLVAHNGDLLRGTIETATAQSIAFRAGLESIAIPRERAAAAIWLEAPPTNAEEPAAAKGAPAKKADPPPLPDAFDLPARPSHWLTLRSGARLGLLVESFGPEAISGQSPTLGPCRIPAEHVHHLRSSEPPRDGASAALSGWQLVPAPEPSPEGAARGDASPIIGKIAPNIQLPLLAGGTFDLAKENNQVVVLDFWATWCGPCVRSLPEMIDTFSKLDPARVKFIAVNQAESPETIKAFLKQRGWPEFAVALDSNQSAGRAYGVEGIPHTVIVGPDGKVARVSTGFRPGGAAELSETVKKLLAGEPVP